MGWHGLFADLDGVSAAVWSPIRHLRTQNDSAGKHELFSHWIDFVCRLAEHDYAHRLSCVTLPSFFFFFLWFSGIRHGELILERPIGAVSGIGGGGILTSVMIVISDVVSLEKRGTYQGVLGMVVALANSLGPLVGGVFSEKVSWRWCFVREYPPKLLIKCVNSKQ